MTHTRPNRRGITAARMAVLACATAVSPGPTFSATTCALPGEPAFMGATVRRGGVGN